MQSKKQLLITLCATLSIWHITHVFGQTENIVEQRLFTVKTLLDRAVDHFKKHSVAQSCRDFAGKTMWRNGNTFLALFDNKGTCFIFDNESIRIWDTFADYRDTDDKPLIEKIFKTEKTQLSLFFNNLTMEIRSRTIIKDGKKYALACCFYPSRPEYFAVKLVDEACQSFQKIGIPETLALINDPRGNFIRGDMYVAVFDQEGNLRASGETYAHIGKITTKSHVSKYMSMKQDLLKNFTESNMPTQWITIKNPDGRSRKKSYLKKYTDPISQMTYTVSATYHEGLNADTTYSFAQRAIAYLKVRGKEEALVEFNNPTSQFSRSGMKISVYTPDGLCLAHAEDPTFVGHNILNRTSSDGRFYTRELIDAVKKYDKIWVTQFNNRLYELVYAERINLPEGTFIVASGFYIDSDKNSVMDMVERAIDYIKRHTFEESILQFVGTDSNFLRGNIHISLFGTDGICLADGPFGKTNIWSYMPTRDDIGQEVIRKILNTANMGGGWVRYRQFNANYNAYVQRVNSYTKEGGTESLIVLSGYYD